MHPILFEIAGVKIHAYGFFIAIGYLASLWLISRLARNRGLDPARFFDLAFLALVSGVIGGRILFVLTNWRYFRQYPAEIFSFWQGGLVFYGGFLMAALACWGYIRWRNLPLRESLDILAPPLALGHAIGRIGCFAAGCCYGSYCPLPWGTVFHSEMIDPALRGLPLHPTQLYEALSVFLLTGFLLRMFYRRRQPAGTVALTYIVVYAALRAVIEMFRGDSIRGFLIGNWLSTSQAIAIALLVGAVAWYVRERRATSRGGSSRE